MTYRILFFLMAVGLLGCRSANPADEALAQQHCGSCHQFPSPDLLDKAAWHGVLKHMAIRLGVKSQFKEDTLSYFDKEVLSKQQLLSDTDWQRIQNYYAALAPEQLPTPAIPSLQPIENLFEVRIGQTATADVPNISCIAIDERRKQLYATDEVNQQIWILNAQGLPVGGFAGLPAVSSVQLLDKQLFVTYIGKDVRLTNQKNGYNQLVSIDQQKPRNGQLLLQNLYRPAQSLLHDLNDDGKKEIITCEFGVNTGKFSVWEQQDDKFVEQVLDNQPGAIQTKVIDWNKDNRPDLLTLFAQGDERLVLYENQGNLKFKATTLLRFPPVYGSSSFEVLDEDKDGHWDILYTCGDNADYSIIPKPYHGVYLYKNGRDNTFKQTYFYPLHGAYKVRVADFDQDGDTDWAVIAYYADFNEPFPRGFMYFEKNGASYSPKSLNLSRLGRWLVMDIGDIDQDGDIDIALGSHPYGEMIGNSPNAWKNSSGVLLLINKTMNNK